MTDARTCDVEDTLAPIKLRMVTELRKIWNFSGSK
jgi:hypothetical protein